MEPISSQSPAPQHRRRWRRLSLRLAGIGLVALLATRGWSQSPAPSAAPAVARPPVALSPNDLVERGLTKGNQGELDGAMADFNEALRLDPNFVRALGNRGNVRAEKGDLAGALADFSRIIELDPKSARAYASRANLRNGQDDFTGALADFNRAIELDPKNEMVLVMRGTAKANHGDLDGAMADLDQALKLDPELAPALFLRGKLRQDKGDLAGATVDFNQAVKLDPSLADAIRQSAAGSAPRIAFPSASVNGQPVRAILDTGTSLAVLLTTEGAQRLGLRLAPTANPVANATVEGLTATLELTVGEVSAKAQIATLNLPTDNFDLLVGWPAVKDSLLLFMGASRTVAIVTGDDASVPDTSGWLKVKISTNHQDVLHFEIPLPDGTTGTFLVDTGDFGGVALPMDRWKEWRAAHPLAPLPTTRTKRPVMRASMMVEETQADSVSLGALTLTHVPLRNMGTGEDTDADKPGTRLAGVLGLAALARMDLVVDGKNGVAYLRPLPTPGTGAAGTASLAPAAQSQNWTVVRQTGLSRPALMLYAAKYKLATRDAAGAIADCTRILETDPLAAEAWFWRAMAKSDAEDYAGALADFNRALELNPKNEEAYAARGGIKAQANDNAGALADFTRVLELDPKNVEAYAIRGAIKAQNNDNAGALADFTHALDLDPKHTAVYAGRGEVKARTGDNAGALADYTRVLESDPKNVEAYFRRGYLRAETDDPAGAIADFTRVLEFAPKNVEAYVYRGSLRRLTGDYVGTLADFTHVLELSPKNVPAYTVRGSVREQTGDYSGALADFTRVLELDPKNAPAYSSRGRVKLHTADYVGALADFNQALELAPQDAGSHGSRAMVREILGDAAGALADYDQAIALDPANATYHRLYRQLLQLRQGSAPADFAQTVGGWKEGWAKTIGLFLIGQRDEAALFAAAEQRDEEPVTGQRCEAWYFAGQLRLLKGDRTGAREAFEKSVATGQRDYNEHLFAQAALARLATPAK